MRVCVLHTLRTIRTLAVRVRVCTCVAIRLDSCGGELGFEVIKQVQIGVARESGAKGELRS